MKLYQQLEYLEEQLKKARKKAGEYADDSSLVQELEDEVESCKELIKMEEEYK